MHTLTVVLVLPDTANLWETCRDLVRPHQIVWDDLDRPSRLDYWTVGRESIADAESAALLGVADDEDLARNVCFVSRLPPDFVPGAVVTPDGRWYDLQDHGWRFIARDEPDSLAAETRWLAQVRELFAAHRSCVAIEIDTHS
ncbi:MAG: hypothetical protein C0483_19935 [Pirellula sp.]|nr:hypothetical protein [Pirellula sp.]